MTPANRMFQNNMSVTDALNKISLFTTSDLFNQSNQTTIKPSLSPLEELNKYSEFKAAVIINRLYLYVLVGIGVPGSILALLTICKMKPLTSSSFYIAVLSMVDGMVLVLKLLYLVLTGNDIRLFDFGCKIFVYTATFLMHFSNWLLVSMTIERFIAIRFPLKVTKLCTKRRACVIICIVAVVLCFVNLHFFGTFGEKHHKIVVWQCAFYDEYSAFGSLVWYWIDGAIYSIVPFILLVIFNTLIICGVKNASEKKKTLTNRITLKATNDQMTQHITRMLICVSVVFIILTLPNCALFIIQSYWEYKNHYHSYAIYYLVYNVIFFLSDLNHAINFYLYFISGKKFRKLCIATVCNCRRSRTLQPNIFFLNNSNSRFYDVN